MAELILTGARTVLDDATWNDATVIAREGRIVEIQPGRTQVPGAIDLQGDWLIPGLVEVHADHLEHHAMPRPRVGFPMRQALQAHDAGLAAAGITTSFDAIGVGDPYGEGFRAVDQSAILQGLDELEQAGCLRARHLIHVRCELPAADATTLFEPFARHPRLALMSLMDHTPGQRQWTDIEHARVFYTGKKGWSDERFSAELARSVERQRLYTQPNRRWFVEFARAEGIVLATHDDTTRAHVDEAVSLGARISEFPTTLAAAERARQRGLHTIAGAPNVVRGGSHSGNVSALTLARNGLLDGLSSDYAPASLLAAAWELRRQADFEPHQAIRVVSRGPALAAGLDDRGAIAPGMLADLVHVREVSGVPVVRQVFVDGRRVC